MNYVEKWVAHFNSKGELKVVKARFRKTAKLYIPDEDDTGHPIHSALSWHTRFDHDDWRLADTSQDALAALYQREEQNWERAAEEIREIEERKRLITIEQAEHAV